ncbi:MAG: Hpt domain-containing protein [Butyricicoccus sp.]|nr:Hpt domain-containing protein [Butyricicoccus sp.]
MSLKDCYAALEGNFDEVLGRLRSERMIQKFVLKFLNDGSYDSLCAAMKEGSAEEAFRAAHTIKGVCQNLSFTKLGKSSSELTEALRGGFSPEANELAERVKADYRQTVSAIRAFEAEVNT